MVNLIHPQMLFGNVETEVRRYVNHKYLLLVHTSTIVNRLANKEEKEKNNVK